MTPPEPSGSTKARPEHPNADEAEGNDLENNFMEIIVSFKKEVKKSLNEINEKTKH